MFMFSVFKYGGLLYWEGRNFWRVVNLGLNLLYSRFCVRSWDIGKNDLVCVFKIDSV